MKKTIAVDRSCGWPNLTRLPDGSIVTAVFNQMSHGQSEGEVDCYRSEDCGESWKYAGTPTFHTPGRNRMNVACGLTSCGDYLALVGGWDGRPLPGEVPPPFPECNRLPAVVCCSNDGCKTFEQWDFDYQIPGNDLVLVPYGDLLRLDGRLACACYTCSKDMQATASYMVFSEDDGRSWTSHGVISENNYHETALWFSGCEEGIALARENHTNRLDQFITRDGGRTWRYDQQVTCAGIHPGHIADLGNGKLLLTAGIRMKNHWGIGASISMDSGKHWGSMAGLCGFGAVQDGGYPSSILLDNGDILTHYYVNGVPFNERYFVGQVIWSCEELFG